MDPFWISKCLPPTPLTFSDIKLSRYHEGDQVVVVQWRRKLSQETFA
jgi:hypothetical protein